MFHLKPLENLFLSFYAFCLGRKALTGRKLPFFSFECSDCHKNISNHNIQDPVKHKILTLHIKENPASQNK